MKSKEMKMKYKHENTKSIIQKMPDNIDMVLSPKVNSIKRPTWAITPNKNNVTKTIPPIKDFSNGKVPVLNTIISPDKPKKGEKIKSNKSVDNSLNSQNEEGNSASRINSIHRALRAYTGGRSVSTDNKEKISTPRTTSRTNKSINNYLTTPKKTKLDKVAKVVSLNLNDDCSKLYKKSNSYRSKSPAKQIAFGKANPTPMTKMKTNLNSNNPTSLINNNKVSVTPYKNSSSKQSANKNIKELLRSKREELKNKSNFTNEKSIALNKKIDYIVQNTLQILNKKAKAKS